MGFYAGEHERAEAQALVDAARAVFQELGDELGLAYCEHQQAGISWAALRAEETREATRRGIEHAERAGAEHLLLELSGWEITPLVPGPVPVDEALRITDAALERSVGRLLLEARLWTGRGRLLAMRGDFEAARELVQAGIGRALDAGLLVDGTAATALAMGFVEDHAGDLAAAERVTRESAAELEQLGDRAFLPTVAVMLATLLVRRGADDEAEHWCRVARETSAPDDLVNFAYADVLDGLLLARRGDPVEGELLVRRGVELTERTDFYKERGYAQEVLAETLALAGKQDEAREAAECAVAIYEAKGDRPFAARARRQLESLTVSV
jgi:tetratricopeptide (TPR) repeat protein